MKTFSHKGFMGLHFFAGRQSKYLHAFNSGLIPINNGIKGIFLKEI
jgi:hypothetical protein